MGRIYSKRGISKSAYPHKRTLPKWVRMNARQIEERICKLAKIGMPPSKIGAVLLDVHGLGPHVLRITGNKILQVLKCHMVLLLSLSTSLGGYRHIDCAHLYGNEVEVGQALGEAFSGGLKREEVFLTSKIYYTLNSHKKIENSVGISLRNFRVAYLDLYLVHWTESSVFGDATDPPSKSGTDYRTFMNQLKILWAAMEVLVKKGLVRAKGVSNFSIQQLEELLLFVKIVPAVNQVMTSIFRVELHPFWRQDQLVKFCKLKGIHVSAHTPLGVPTAKHSRSDNLSGDDELGTPRISIGWSRSIHGPMLKLDVVAEIAKRCQNTPK